ncbi:hypothetical protein [Zunongwangia profunda]|jgi:hypothetical protein|uniref:hypothetical protein n=1 Tax=Zunongwangia profunda TaxID=398743 RepID=UPI001D1807BB|nr:hypothetical protein [Zunongwangia profunda]MCC4228613.1 hypothetical protein [Zunongwangia profunda]|tara:strand:- start:230 stop:1924 length:1695 start_codon:yes stop_codon:yes gene_type:complete
MIKIIQRLEFEDVFPEEEKQEVLFYLKKVSRETLLKSIGFFNTNNLPNFDNFFSNPEIAKDIYDRIVDYSKKNGIKNKPETVSKHASLKLSELILSNRKELLEDNENSSIDEDEINLFKAFLVVNREINKNQNLESTSNSNFSKLVDFSVIFNFPLSDLAIFENDDLEFLKLTYTTLVKVEFLFDFLNSEPEFENLKVHLIASFNTDNEEDFFKEMKYLFGKLLELKTSNNYIFKVEDENSEKFLTSMTSDDILTDEDFTYIKINPIYKIEEHTYSIVNYFYVIDKFYRSSKFKIKEIYESDSDLKSKYGNFFNFFNKEFSENFLMKKVLDEIFHKPYFTKKPESDTELPGEPDYYLRHNNNIFLFENKDVLIAKAVKASADIEKINKTLKIKFLGDENHKVGIGQLINTIEEILEKKFRFDSYVNSKNNLKIYPILLVHDRIFQTLGINYRLNSWYLESLEERLSDKFNLSNIKSLTVIDIDTIILWSPYLKEKDKRFKDLLDSHLNKLNSKFKINTPNYEYGMEIANKRLTDKITPISYRNIPYNLPTELFIDKFRGVLKEE